MRIFSNHSLKIKLLLGILVLLTACGGSGVNEQASATPTLERQITPTASPTDAPDLVYLIGGGEQEEKMASRVEDTIATLSVASGDELIILDEILDSDIKQNAKVIFFLPPDPGLNDLVMRYPTVQFVAIGIHGLNDAGNLTRIGPDGMGADQIGFIAGVIAASITPDWRVGAISVQNSSQEHASNLAFQNGAIFYCGLCRPAYPPFQTYPVGAEAFSSEISAVQEAIFTLISLNVEMIFLSPELSAAASADMPEGPGLSYIGGEAPKEDLGDKWIATVRAAPELAIEEIWDHVYVDEGGWTLSMPIIIEDVNHERLSSGRETWVLEILQDLIDGYIDTGVDPITGVAR
jgi:hypothetical protein